MVSSIGIDVGNYDTKSQNTTTPSSFKTGHTKDLLSQESVFYNGVYYSVTDARNNQQLDKTKNGYCIAISLFAIAKEIIWQLTEEYKSSHNGNLPSNSYLQMSIDKISGITLGVGTPAGHYSALKAKMEDCYNTAFKNGIEFTYNDFSFNLRLEKPVCVYPQDFAAVAFNDSVETVREFNEYYIIGIGGGTTDVIPVKDGIPQTDICRSLAAGTTIMYEYIISALQRETGKTMGYSSIESVLLERNNLIDEKRKEIIRRAYMDFINKMVDDLVHLGLDLESIPSVFVGGGALLMKPALEANSLFVKTEFVTDVRANAKYYASFSA